MHKQYDNIEMNQRNWVWRSGSLGTVARLCNSKEHWSPSTEENLLISWINVDYSRIILYIDSMFSVFLRFSKNYCSQIEMSGEQHFAIIITILCDLRLMQGVKSHKWATYPILNLVSIIA